MLTQPNASAPACAGTCNDDSCDIAAGGAPAATLLLPYFEVDLGDKRERTTLFSVTNVSPYAQIAHVTLWTDWGFPVLVFNLYLTGYDVQPINLCDVIARGVIGSSNGTSTSSPNASSSAGTTANTIGGGMPSGTNGSIGTQPFRVTTLQGNPNFLPSASESCGPGRQPGVLPAGTAADVRALLSTGLSTGASINCLASSEQQRVGGNHGGNVAIGYITIDVVATCSAKLPIDPSYFTDEILFDNVLIGDYQDVNQSTTGSYAGGNPLVHIRAIPEGGAAAAGPVATNLPFTFYDRYNAPATGIGRTFDRRQPLPSVFAARWISGTAAGFETEYKIWREGFTSGTGGGVAACEVYVLGSAIPLVEVVRFDEHENAGVAGLGIIVATPTASDPTAPGTMRVRETYALFPLVAGSKDAGGWMYMNLSNGGDTKAYTYYGERPYNATRPGFGAGRGTPGKYPRDVSQNWVIVSTFSEGRYGTYYDAAWLGNGCSPAAPAASSGGTLGNAVGRIAPLGGVLVCPTGQTTANSANGNAQCTGTNITP